MGGIRCQNYLPPRLMPTAQDIWIATWISNGAGQDHSETLPDHFFQGNFDIASQSKSITWMFNMFQKCGAMCWFQLELQNSLLDTALIKTPCFQKVDGVLDLEDYFQTWREQQEITCKCCLHPLSSSSSSCRCMLSIHTSKSCKMHQMQLHSGSTRLFVLMFDSSAVLRR